MNVRYRMCGTFIWQSKLSQLYISEVRVCLYIVCVCLSMRRACISSWPHAPLSLYDEHEMTSAQHLRKWHQIASCLVSVTIAIIRVYGVGDNKFFFFPLLFELLYAILTRSMITYSLIFCMCLAWFWTVSECTRHIYLHKLKINRSNNQKV